MHPGLKVFAPCIAGTGLLLIANAAISGSGWLVPMAVIVGAALTMAGILILTSGKQRNIRYGHSPIGNPVHIRGIMSNEEREIKNVMIFGVGFALFGLVCPFFWLSLFNGNSGSQTWVYGVHSGFFIALGLVFLGKGWYDLRQLRAIRPVEIPE